MDNVVVGQLVIVSYIEGYWVYGVVTDTFDGRFSVENEVGNRIMYHDKDNQGEATVPSEFLAKNVNITPLFRDKKPVLLKKSLLGKYKFPK